MSPDMPQDRTERHENDVPPQNVRVDVQPPNASERRTHVLVDVTHLNVEFLRDYARRRHHKTGPLAQAAQAIGTALNQQEKNQ